MRTILGFLNQNEWILNLNIGNIMQIQPVRMRDFLTFTRNEQQLSRESFLEKLQLLVVSYFCVSTELRFIIQSRSGFMKPEIKKEKELEQEYWHVKALDISCSFLPSECPLFNHILLSYQKHHDPTLQPIEEDKEQEDTLAVLRPLRGIENSKYQPIVRQVDNVYVDIAEIPMSPLSRCFDQRLVPKKTKTTSSNAQTDPIEPPQPPLMKSQSISVQGDLKLEEDKPEPKEEKKPEQREEIASDIFDANNAYLDLGSSRYQESLISKIIEDPKISDKQLFLNKLITRVQSQDPEKFKGIQFNSYAAQNLNSNAKTNINTNTLSAEPSNMIEDGDIYGGSHSLKPSKGKSGLYSGKPKNSQSGQLTYKQRREQQNFDDLQHSFDHKSHVGSKHVRSLYGDVNSSTDGTAIGGGVKHHIASQSLAPSQNVFQDQKMPPRSKHVAAKNQASLAHKKNQSISGTGLESKSHQEMFTKTTGKPNAKQTMDIVSSVQRKFNNSVNSNFS